jgi:hypothetical protein
MEPLLGNRFAPLTWEIGFLHTPRERVIEGFRDWTDEPLEWNEIRDDLPGLLCRLAPTTDVEATRYLFVGTDGEWTAFLDNGWLGTDAVAPMSVLARTLGVRGVRARWVPDDPSSPEMQRGTVILATYSPRRTDYINFERTIEVGPDGDRWAFDLAGEPFAFEELDRYEAARKRDRFTPEMLDRYLKELGIRMFDPTFYAPDDQAVLASTRARHKKASEYAVPGCVDVAGRSRESAGVDA